MVTSCLEKLRVKECIDLFLGKFDQVRGVRPLSKFRKKVVHMLRSGLGIRHFCFVQFGSLGGDFRNHYGSVIAEKDCGGCPVIPKIVEMSC